MQSELAELSARAAAAGERLATLSISTEVRFLSAEQRAAFTGALQTAILGVVKAHSAPFLTADESGGGGAEGTTAGRAYRLVLGCYPLLRAGRPDTENSAGVPEAATSNRGGES
jgi:hypothetical protein